jgi:BNR repeat-containing family member
MVNPIYLFILISVLTGCEGLPALVGIGGTLPVPNVPNDSNVTTIADQATVTGVYGVTTGFYDEPSNTTFVTWMGESSYPYVQAYDHTKGTWSDAKQVGINPSQDWHNTPSLTQLKDGRLLVTHPQHYEAAPFKIATSPEPRSMAGQLSEWNDHEVKEAPAAAYPKPVRLSNGDIYIFYRETSKFVYPDKNLYADDRPIQYVWSENNGKSWQSSKSVAGDIAIGSWGDSDNFNEIYLGQIRYDEERNRIHLVWTTSGGGPKGPNNHDSYHKDVFYAYFDPSNRKFYCLTEGQSVEMGYAINKNDMRRCVVEDTGPPDNNGYQPQAVDYVQIVQWDVNGNPLVGYHISQVDNKGFIHVAKWTGSEWSKSDVIEGAAGYFAQPIELERLTDNSFLLHVLNGDLTTYISEDGAKTWRVCATVKAPKNSSGFGRLSLIRNYRQPVQFHAFEFANQEVTGPNFKIRSYSLRVPSCASSRDTASNTSSDSR